MTKKKKKAFYSEQLAHTQVMNRSTGIRHRSSSLHLCFKLDSMVQPLTWNPRVRVYTFIVLITFYLALQLFMSPKGNHHGVAKNRT